MVTTQTGDGYTIQKEHTGDDNDDEEEEEKKDDESESVQERWSTNSVSDRELTGEHTSSLIITIMIIMIIMIMIIAILMRRR